MEERLIQELIEQTEMFHGVLQEAKGVESVRYLREVLASFKQLAPVVQGEKDTYGQDLYTKMQEGIVQLAKEITSENYHRAATYVERVFLPDLALLCDWFTGELHKKDVLIGFYHPEWNPLNTASKDRLHALIAEVERQGLQAIFFESTDVDIDKEEIHAKVVVNGEIQEVTSRYPDVIYNKNTGSYRNQDRVQRVLRRTIPFMQHLITDKLHLPLEMHGESELSGLFVPSTYVQSLDDVEKFFQEHNVGVLKDTKEERGEGIYFLRKEHDKYTIQYGKVSKIVDEEYLLAFITNKISKSTFLLQKYIESKDDLGKSNDFRFYIRKDHVGNWEAVQDYARISAPGNILTHNYYGGSRKNTEKFLTGRYGVEDGKEAYNSLKAVAIQITKDVDRLYDYALDELGIDLVIDNNHQIWMYEVNTGPWTGFFEELRAQKLVPYLRYLALSKQLPHNRFQNSVGFNSEEAELEEVVFSNEQVIGMLVPTIDQASRIAGYVAKEEGTPFFVFTPGDVDAERQKVRGHFLEEDAWVEKIAKYPTFIVDRLRKRHERKFIYLYSEFEDISKTYDFEPRYLEQHSLYEHLFKDESIRQYLLPHLRVHKVKDAMQFVDVFDHILVRIEQTNEVILLQRVGKDIQVTRGGLSTVYSLKEFRSYLRTLLKDHSLFMQRMIEQETVYRMRIHYIHQEDEWKRQLMYPVIYPSMNEIYEEEPLAMYPETHLFMNRTVKMPTGTWNQLLEVSDQIATSLGEVLNIPLHHFSLDFVIDTNVEDEIYFVESNMDEPTDSYIIERLIRPIVRFVTNYHLK